MWYWTYVLQSKKDGKMYVGYSHDLKGRLEAHNKGYVASTKNRCPLVLIYSEMCRDKKDALQREKYLKTHLGKLFIHKRLKTYLTGCKKS